MSLDKDQHLTLLLKCYGPDIKWTCTVLFPFLPFLSYILPSAKWWNYQTKTMWWVYLLFCLLSWNNNICEKLTVPPGSTDPWSRGQWRRSTAVIKNFRCGKFAAGVKIRHAVFCFMKYFNPRVFQSLLTFESVKSLWKHNERKQLKFHLIYSVLRISQCVSR